MDELKEKAASVEGYCKLGLYLVPLVPNDKKPYWTDWGSQSTNDPNVIIRELEKDNRRNIGVVIGKSGLIGIDIDNHGEGSPDGNETLREFENSYGRLPDTWQALTPHGGMHIYFRKTDAFMAAFNELEEKSIVEAEGIEIYTGNKQTVMPPSAIDGKRYEWEYSPEDCDLADASGAVIELLKYISSLRPEKESKKFEVPEKIPVKTRTNTLVKLICSLTDKGLSNEAIEAAVRIENSTRCEPPLTEEELTKDVIPAIGRYKKGMTDYASDARIEAGMEEHCRATSKNGVLEPIREPDIAMVRVADVIEKEPEWLISGYIPKGQITTLAGDGGSGKTSVWCAIAAAVSSGKPCFMLQGIMPDEFQECKPEKVLFFSSEDSVESVLVKRLRANNANMDNIFTIDISDERFKDVKFNSKFLESLMDKYSPALAIFDPIQSYIQENINMAYRNAMRAQLNPLTGFGEKYNCAILLIVHCNKRDGAYGRNRISDSSDIWDISRSVIMAGETSENGIRYLSHEKSNYGRLEKTVLYSIGQESKIMYKGISDKKDRDYVSENRYTRQEMPRQDEAKEFIISFLKDGKKDVKDLESMAKAEGISLNSLKAAKAALKKEKKIYYIREDYAGKVSIALTDI